ncbi:MAG: IclR family transcriptional regulator [Spirochaetaceae bacterium]|nr:MAG: IclR family transcriptional regulator [Spirochaetaceae bacterium]
MSVQSLDRALDILELLAQRPNGSGVTRVAAELGLHKSTAGRLLVALRQRGYLEKDPATATYRVGLKCVELAGAHLDHLELKVEAKPAMYQLSQFTGQTVFLAILKARYMVYVEKTEAYNSLRRYSIIGTRAPLHCTALGKAALMALPQSRLDVLLAELPLEPRTPRTHTSRDALLADLEQARQRGYAFDDRENESSVRCVAAPLIDYRGLPLASVSVSGPAQQISQQDVDRIGQAVRRTAQEISTHLGWRQPQATRLQEEERYENET